MTMIARSARPALAALALLAVSPFAAEAHRAWMLPSATVLSGENTWVTVDAAISNDLFYFEHNPMRFANVGSGEDEGPRPAAAKGGAPKGGEGGPPRRGNPAELVITAPDGSRAQAQNGSVGRFRTTFDVHLAQKGTYKLAAVNDGLFATYKEGGQVKRWRGTAEALAKEVPANAEELKVTQTQSRNEIFLTSGKPSLDALKPIGSGLELVPVTHPNDLVVGEAAKFRFTIDGKPAADLAVTVIPGGIRYRDKLNEMAFKTDADGVLTLKVAEPGMYWLNASVQDDKAAVKNATRRASYTATLEALPQ